MSKSRSTRLGEIQEGLDDAIEPQDLARNDFHLRHDIGIAARQFRFRDFDVQQDRVQRILHLVRDTSRDTADGGESVGGLQFAVQFALSFRIAQPNEESGAGVCAWQRFQRIDGQQHDRHCVR